MFELFPSACSSFTCSLLDVFGVLDTNNTGFVKAHEITLGMSTALGVDVSPAEVRSSLRTTAVCSETNCRDGFHRTVHAPRAHRNQQILVTRNRPPDADSSFAV